MCRERSRYRVAWRACRSSPCSRDSSIVDWILQVRAVYPDNAVFAATGGTELIVGTFFHGDDDNVLARAQHDIYGDALGILLSSCNRFTRFSKAVLNDTEHVNWGQIESCDHRTLQRAHDLLAAVWRYENASQQKNFHFSTHKESSPELLWIDWLRKELSAWIDHPHLVRSVQLILANQNKPIGYAAESRLCTDIVDRFHSVPWNNGVCKALSVETALSEGSPPSKDVANNGGRDSQSEGYPFDEEALSAIAYIAKLIRSRTTSMPASDLRSAAAVIFALERLPHTTPGVDASFSFAQPDRDGNFGWADGEISEDAFRLFLGEHYYTTAVGGDTEHRIAFETYSGSNRIDGEIENWLEVARVIERGGHLTFEDNSDIDWEMYL